VLIFRLLGLTGLALLGKLRRDACAFVFAAHDFELSAVRVTITRRALSQESIDLIVNAVSHHGAQCDRWSGARSHRRVDCMRRRIGFEPELHIGTCFVVWLPLAPPQAA